ncbi:MAG TPA: transketolase C-terminal domain-containing protein [Steroidobacteraceae bacterium]|jgi:2-oxoisovalerate dehydrogenase E1 component|nr:transketolase C-terminal domain-containing protein [Steroidobacteraceae bacterium]
MPAAASQVPHPGAISPFPDGEPDWRRVTYLLHASRALDDLEESRLLPQRQVLYQFSARGHDFAQILLGLRLTDPHDGVTVYYRSRPVMLALGVGLEDAAAGPLARQGSFSGGRDIGVVFNKPGRGEATVLPACGGVGAQYTPAAGWAQAIRYHHDALGESEYARSIAVVLGGDASVATGGFWSALTMATTLRLPMLFYIEDNGFGISVPSQLQTPGGNIAANLRSFAGLTLLEGDGAEPLQAAQLVSEAVRRVREERGPLLLRLTVPRLCGHSGQDTQAYKSPETLSLERARDPLQRLQRFLVPRVLSDRDWTAVAGDARRDVEVAVEKALARPLPDPRSLTRHVFAESTAEGVAEVQEQGGLAAVGCALPPGTPEPRPEAARINMLTAIRRTLDFELALNPRMIVFGEDVGPKGGVHGATLGLQEKHGAARVFDTSLSEEGIIGRAIGLALAGLLPVPEIQFRKYADPAAEQLNDCGTMRWRTRNRFAAPMVVRLPGGFFKCGDPWHSQTNEVAFVHSIGWRVAVPSNAEDATGLLRSALRGNDPTLFFEHRALLDGAWARRPYPGDEYVVPFGVARRVRAGAELTIVTWGAMVERCERAGTASGVDAEILDLRTLSPWDRQAVLASVRKTHRCLIVHEDNLTAGFGAEIAACVAKDAFFSLDAPIERLAMPDIPSPHSPRLLEAAVPGVESITQAIQQIASI